MASRYFTNYRDQLFAAIAARKVPAGESFAGPRMGRLTVLVAGLVTAYLAMSIVFTPSAGSPAYHFVDSRGAVTVLSAIFLAMGSGFALASVLLSAGESAKTRLFWLVLAMAIGLLALDELVGLNTRIGRRLDNMNPLGLIGSGWFPCWNDAIVMFYGAGAILIAAIFLPNALRYPRVVELLAIAGGFYVVHTAIDAFAEPTTLAIILEESAKLYSVALIALAMLAGLLYHVRKARELGEAQSDAPGGRSSC